MANPKHLAILDKGVKHWNAWRFGLYKKGNKVHPDLSGANLFGKELNGIDFSQVDLHGCDFRWAWLMGADLRGTCLAGARFANAVFVGAHFGDTVIRIDLEPTEITWFPPITGDALGNKRPNFTGAQFGGTIIEDTDLSHWEGLEDVKHLGRSIVAIEALLRSQCRIPLPFLRGCGLPDKLIEYLPSLTQGPIQFYSCFISYSTKDQAFADRLYADLQNRAVRCWFAPHDIQGGKKVHEQIDLAIRVYDRLLLILSDNSMNSEWVKTEIANARQREVREKRQMLFPISLVPFEKIRDWKAFDADTGKDSGREIREYYIPDFSNWKDHDSYQHAFHRLLRDLKAEGSVTK